MPITVQKHFVKGGDTKFYRYPREPECQRQWILPGIRCNWGSNRAYPCMEQLFCQRYTLIRRLWWFLQRVKLVYIHRWPELVACCHVRIFGCFFFLGQLQSWKQLDAYNYFHCSCVRTILWGNDCCILCWIPVMSHTWQYPPPNILVHEDTCRTLCIHSSQSVLVQS